MGKKKPHEAGICGAKTRAGTPCQKAPMPNGRCHLHGGKTPGGIASANFKHGRYSKYLPDGLANRYQSALQDAAMLEMRDEIAAIDARIAQLMERVHEGADGSLFSEIEENWVNLMRALRAQNTTRQAHYIGVVDRLISNATSDTRAWQEIYMLWERRRRMVESERKRIQEAQQYVTAQQAMALMAAVLNVIKENVHDKSTLAAISAGVNALIAGDAG